MKSALIARLINAGTKYILAPASMLALCACHGLPSFRRAAPPAAASISTPAAAVTQSGTAAVPAVADVKTETRNVPLPSGSEIVFNEKLGTVTLKLSRDSTLATETRTEHVAGPKSFDPPAPPTPADEAKGFGVRAFWVGALVCFAAAGLAVWAGHPLAGGCFGLAGVALPVLANFATSTAALVAAAGLLAAGGALWAAWHVIDARHGLEAGQRSGVVPFSPSAGATA